MPPSALHTQSLGRRSLVEDHPDGLRRELADLGDRLRHAARDLVLALLGMAFVEGDVDERHAAPPSALTSENSAVRYHAGSRATRRLVKDERRDDRPDDEAEHEAERHEAHQELPRAKRVEAPDPAAHGGAHEERQAADECEPSG